MSSMSSSSQGYAVEPKRQEAGIASIESNTEDSQRSHAHHQTRVSFDRAGMETLQKSPSAASDSPSHAESTKSTVKKLKSKIKEKLHHHHRDGYEASHVEYDDDDEYDEEEQDEMAAEGAADVPLCKVWLIYCVMQQLRGALLRLRRRTLRSRPAGLEFLNRRQPDAAQPATTASIAEASAACIQ